MKKLILVALGLMLFTPTVAMANGYGYGGYPPVTYNYGYDSCYYTTPVVSQVVTYNNCDPVVPVISQRVVANCDPVVPVVSQRAAVVCDPIVPVVSQRAAVVCDPVVPVVSQRVAPVCETTVTPVVSFRVADCSRYYVPSNVNIRECPYTSSDIVGKLYGGSYFYGAPYNGTNWYSIYDDCGNFRGYSYNSCFR